MSFDFSTDISSVIGFSFTNLNVTHYGIMIRAAIIDGDSSGTIIFNNGET